MWKKENRKEEGGRREPCRLLSCLPDIPPYVNGRPLHPPIISDGRDYFFQRQLELVKGGDWRAKIGFPHLPLHVCNNILSMQEAKLCEFETSL